MTVIVLLINYPKSTITVVHWNDDSNETLFSSYLLGPLVPSLVQFGNSVNFGCKLVFNFGLKLVPFFAKNVFSDVNN